MNVVRIELILKYIYVSYYVVEMVIDVIGENVLLHMYICA
jgi:hypothetical protein